MHAEYRDQKASLSIPNDVKLHSFEIPADVINKACSAVRTPSPVVSIVPGMTFALVRLQSLDDLAVVRPLGRSLPMPIDAVTDDEKRWLVNNFVMLYFYVIESHTNANFRLRTRMIMDELEDPATGSAASALCSYLALQQAEKDGTKSFEIQQGVEMGRKSDIAVQVTTVARRVTEVRLEGTAVTVMRGQLEVDAL